jgi:hypothetical protein
VFDFKPRGNWLLSPPCQPERWVGHFDFEVATTGWPRDTGNARLCLHNLLLSDKLPLGSPLVVGQCLEVLRGADTAGICRITAVESRARRKIDLCRPVASSFIDAHQLKLSRRDVF